MSSSTDSAVGSAPTSVADTVKEAISADQQAIDADVKQTIQHNNTPVTLDPNRLLQILHGASVQINGSDSESDADSDEVSDDGSDIVPDSDTDSETEVTLDEQLRKLHAAMNKYTRFERLQCRAQPRRVMYKYMYVCVCTHVSQIVPMIWLFERCFCTAIG